MVNTFLVLNILDFINFRNWRGSRKKIFTLQRSLLLYANALHNSVKELHNSQVID